MQSQDVLNKMNMGKYGDYYKLLKKLNLGRVKFVRKR